MAIVGSTEADVEGKDERGLKTGEKRNRGRGKDKNICGI